MENILIAQNIVKSFTSGKNSELHVIKNISLSIPKGKISVIVGKSGAGKSTLLHILGGLDKPDAGTVVVNGLDIAKLNSKKLSEFRNNNVGFVFQFHHLLPEFTALENIIIPQLIKGVSKKEAEKKGLELLQLVGLVERKNHKPSQLSGGEQQRIAVARALANDAEIILADEPTGNLDTANSEAMHNLFVSLRNEFNKTFIIVTHNNELVKLADHIFEIKDGAIVEVQSK